MQPLQALAPANMVPATRRSSESLETATELKQIAFVRVSSVAGRRSTRVYVIEMYHNTPSTRTSSRIPTLNQPKNKALSTSATPSFCSASLTNSPETHKSEAHAERSYADFLGLQGQLLQRVRVAHMALPCEFCREVTSAAAGGGAHPSPLAMLLKTEDELATLFESLVNELLTLTRTRFPSMRGPCSAHAEVPKMLYEFLLGE